MVSVGVCYCFGVADDDVVILSGPAPKPPLAELDLSGDEESERQVHIRRGRKTAARDINYSDTLGQSPPKKKKRANKRTASSQAAFDNRVGTTVGAVGAGALGEGEIFSAEHVS